MVSTFCYGKGDNTITNNLLQITEFFPDWVNVDKRKLNLRDAQCIVNF